MRFKDYISNQTLSFDLEENINRQDKKGLRDLIYRAFQDGRIDNVEMNDLWRAIQTSPNLEDLENIAKWLKTHLNQPRSFGNKMTQFFTNFWR